VPLRVVTGRLPSQIPANLPAREKPEGVAGTRPPTGLTELRIPEREQPCVLYVPEDYDPNLACGVLVRLPAPSGEASSSALDAWKPLCDTRGLILVAPRPVRPERWGRAFVDDVRKLLQQVTDTYRVDPTRIVLHGYGPGGTMAYVTALSARNLVRGVAVVDAPLPMMFPLPANDPARRLAVYVAKSGRTRFAGIIEKNIEAFRVARYPITTTELGAAPRELSADEMEDLADWIDSLDRF